MWNWISQLEKLRSQGIPFVMATITQVTGSTPRNTGAKMIIISDSHFYGTIGGGHLEQLVIRDGMSLIKSNTAQVIRYPLGAKTGQCCGGVVEVLFEPVQCGPHLYLFGAGHVGQAVCKSLVGTPFTVHLIDEREEWIQSPELPKETVRYPGEWSEFVETASWDEKLTYSVVMTHRHDLDQEIIQFLMDQPHKYIGLIGSQSKWERFKQRLSARGVSEDKFSRIQCPIGIPIGGKAPQEVAISLAAELIRIHYAEA